MAIELTACPTLPGLHLGVVEFADVTVGPADADVQAFARVVAEWVRPQLESVEWQQACQEVRQLLRHGKFKASGRSKPAQEYLAGCVGRDGQLPVINGPVDVLNAVSLRYNLPISLLSLSKASRRLHVGRGKAGQTYVFNAAGQELDVTDLITVYDASVEPFRPVGSPVKDSMAGKIEASDRDLVAIIYCPDSQAARNRCDQAEAELRARMPRANGCLFPSAD